MDWLKQSEEMIRLWSETQQKMMAGWLGSMKDFTQPHNVWQKTLDTWETTVKNMLETQAQWVRLWAGGVAATKGIAPETIQGAAQLKDITERWIEFQQNIWQNWFAMVRAVDLSKMAGQPPQALFDAWQDALKRTTDAQQEWLRAWTSSK